MVKKIYIKESINKYTADQLAKIVTNDFKETIKESDYSNYKERISDYLDENGLWIDSNQLDELSHSIGIRDYKFDVCIDCNGEEWFWTYYYDSKHSRSSAYVDATLAIDSRLSYSNATYMLERIYGFVEFLNELY